VVRLHPSAPRGCSSTGRAPRLHRGRCRFDSDRLHLRLRSVNGKHTPFVRPRCGFDSCRRLLRTPVAQRRERCLRVPLGVAGFDSSRAYHFADVAQREEHRSATPGRPVRSGSSASQARGVTGARRAPTSSVRVRDLAGLLQQQDRRGPERFGYLVRAAAHSCAVAVRLRVPTAGECRVSTFRSSPPRPRCCSIPGCGPE
jgi:hypothetical protein